VAVGSIKAKNLIESIRDECEMTIDIENLERRNNKKSIIMNLKVY